MPLLEITNVDISYGKRLIVKDCNLTLEKGEICSIVGESGSGKTTVIRAVLGLLAGGGKVTAGDIVYEGRSLLTLNDKQWRALRGHDISMIFQDSGAMMNQTRLIGKSYVEYILTHENISKKEAWDKGAEMLGRMRLPDPDRIMNSYPFQLSGGQRQRVGIAMGMTYQPRLLLADEPTSALDVTTQAQIVRQMMELRHEHHHRHPRPRRRLLHGGQGRRHEKRRHRGPGQPSAHSARDGQRVHKEADGRRAEFGRETLCLTKKTSYWKPSTSPGAFPRPAGASWWPATT